MVRCFVREEILLVTHYVIIDFDELFWTHFTRHLLSYEIQFIFVLGSPQRHMRSVPRN